MGVSVTASGPNVENVGGKTKAFTLSGSGGVVIAGFRLDWAALRAAAMAIQSSSELTSDAFAARLGLSVIGSCWIVWFAGFG